MHGLSLPLRKNPSPSKIKVNDEDDDDIGNDSGSDKLINDDVDENDDDYGGVDDNDAGH